jgi:cyclophilin family peptidyl-prolyl cis-trans isomerase
MRFILALALLMSWSARADEAATFVRFETTAGSFVVQLNAARAPLTVANFIANLKAGVYDGTIFHRVIAGFVVQGGGYDTQFRERPGKGAIANEAGNGLANRRGTIAMARMDDPHSATTQFYFNVVDNPGLDPLPTRWGYAVFGRVVEGMEVLDTIANVPTGRSGPFETDAPVEPVVLKKLGIVAAPGTTPTPAAPSQSSAADDPAGATPPPGAPPAAP